MVRGRLRPGCPAGPDAGGLGCDHFRPAGGDYGPVCRPGCPNWSAPRHRHRKDGAGWRGDHYTPAGRCLSGPPEAGDRDVHRLSGGGSAAPGLHHQRDGSGPAGDPVRPSGRPGRPDGEGPAVCGSGTAGSARMPSASCGDCGSRRSWGSLSIRIQRWPSTGTGNC